MTYFLTIFFRVGQTCVSCLSALSTGEMRQNAKNEYSKTNKVSQVGSVIPGFEVTEARRTSDVMLTGTRNSSAQNVFLNSRQKTNINCGNCILSHNMNNQNKLTYVKTKFHY